MTKRPNRAGGVVAKACSNDMTSRLVSFSLSFVVCGVAAFLSYNGTSLLLDPYNVVWHRREMPRAAWADQLRSAKIEYLAAHPNIYDTLIVADSRGHANNIREVNRATSSHLFSLFANGDTPIGFLAKVRWAVRTQTKLRRVVLLLTLAQFQVAPKNELLIFHEHPYVTGESWISYYWTFSNLPYQTFLTSARYYINWLFGLRTTPATHTNSSFKATNSGFEVTPTIINSGFDEGTGEANLWGQPYIDFTPSEEDRARFQALVSSDPPGRLRFHNTTIELSDFAAGFNEPGAAPPIREDQINSFIELINVLRSNAIQTEFVVIPLPVVALRWISMQFYLEWMRLVVHHCGAIWDFSLPSRVTADNYNYWDHSHFLPHVSKMMLVRVLGGDLPELKKHPDFGVRVSAVDFESHRVRWEASVDILEGGPR
jgi:hypothetical protein